MRKNNQQPATIIAQRHFNEKTHDTNCTVTNFHGKTKQRKKNQKDDSTKTFTEPFAAPNACNTCMLRYSAKDMHALGRAE